jgi:hypothetical protein
MSVVHSATPDPEGGGSWRFREQGRGFSGVSFAEPHLHSNLYPHVPDIITPCMALTWRASSLKLEVISPDQRPAELRQLPVQACRGKTK